MVKRINNLPKIKTLTAYILFFFTLTGLSQNIDIENITKEKPLKISGTTSFNSVFYNSKQVSNRQPFTYFAQGVLNVSFYSLSIPITYSYSNQGENLDYQLPFNLNRISIHPKYKWITSHIGTVSMSFSPYTLNGHQFTGGGLELSPESPFKISMMAGQLLKATNDTDDPRTLPAYRRMGYGMQLDFVKDLFDLGFSVLYAKDAINSIDSVPETKNILPKENLAISIRSKVKLSQHWILDAEYGSTTITNDLRSGEANNKTSLSKVFINNRTSTSHYDAYKANINYSIGSASVGLGYERINPGYETLGAYFFNNDFENIVVNFRNALFKDKLSFDINVGRQRDNLNNAKASKSSRNIGAINATLALNKRVTISGSYSNLTSFTNTTPNQFEDINDSDLTDEALENLDYKQLSQNAGLNMNYVLSEDKNKPQNLFFNYNLNDVVNEQGGFVRLGDASTFHNFGLGHGINYSKTSVSLNSNINLTYNTIGREEAFTWGPNVFIGKSFFNNAMKSQLSIAYNQSKNTSNATNVLSVRSGATYSIKKKHNLNLNAIYTQRRSANNINEITVTFGYSYSFGLKKPKFNFSKNIKKQNDTIKISYKNYNYLDTPKKITPQILSLIKQDKYDFLREKKMIRLENLGTQLVNSEKEDKKIYKRVAIDYLKCLEDYMYFEKKYESLLIESYLKLLYEAERTTEDYLNDYNYLVDNKLEENIDSKAHDELIDKALVRYKANVDLIKKLKDWNLTNETLNTAATDFKKFMKRYKSICFNKFDKGENDLSIIDFLEIRLADYFYKNILN